MSFTYREGARLVSSRLRAVACRRYPRDRGEHRCRRCRGTGRSPPSALSGPLTSGEKGTIGTRTWLGVLLTLVVFDVEVLAALNLSLTHIWEDYRNPYKQFLMFFCRENRACFWAAKSEIWKWYRGASVPRWFWQKPFSPPCRPSGKPSRRARATLK